MSFFQSFTSPTFFSIDSTLPVSLSVRVFRASILMVPYTRFESSETRSYALRTISRASSIFSVSITVPIAVSLYDTPLSLIIFTILATSSLTLSPLSVGNIEKSKSIDINYSSSFFLINTFVLTTFQSISYSQLDRTLNVWG